MLLHASRMVTTRQPHKRRYPMLTKALSHHRWALNAFFALLISLSTISPNLAAPSDINYVRATIVGTTSELSSFDETIKSLAHAQFENERIGCREGCEALAADGMPTRLIYVFERKREKIFSLLIDAWSEVERTTHNPDFRLTFDTKIPSTDCSPASCKVNPVCSDGCGRPCSAC